MKRTQRKDALRNIGRQKVSYLSIVVIALLGVTMFLGVFFILPHLDPGKVSGRHLFDRLRHRADGHDAVQLRHGKGL